MNMHLTYTDDLPFKEINRSERLYDHKIAILQYYASGTYIASPVTSQNILVNHINLY